MTYLGEIDGVKGYHFMCNSGAVFIGATATFDEMIFPHCKGTDVPNTTDFGFLPPLDAEKHDHSHGTDDGDNDNNRPPPCNLPSSSNDDDDTSEHSACDDTANAPPDRPLVTPEDFAPRREDQDEWNELPR